MEATKVHGFGDASITALDHVDLDIAKGKFTAVMGSSGSGKSTLMHCLAGLDSLTSGKVWLGSVEISSLSERQCTQLRRDKIGFIFQAFNLLPTLNAEENMLLPLALAGLRADPAWKDELVRRLGIGDRLGHKPSQLSGGQQQRVAAARALVGRPEVIFADEPTGNLDSYASAALLELLASTVRELGQTVVMVTHDPVAAGYADRAVFLRDGRVVADMDAPTSQAVLEQMNPA